jgi:hypothetical protein
MKIRSLMARGAIAATIAAGGVGLTSTAAQASCNYQWLLQQRNYYQGLADWEYASYWANVNVGDFAGADYQWELYIMDLSTVQNYTSRLNMCNFREP